MLAPTHGLFDLQTVCGPCGNRWPVVVASAESFPLSSVVGKVSHSQLGEEADFACRCTVLPTAWVLPGALRGPLICQNVVLAKSSIHDGFERFPLQAWIVTACLPMESSLRSSRENVIDAFGLSVDHIRHLCRGRRLRRSLRPGHLCKLPSRWTRAG